MPSSMTLSDLKSLVEAETQTPPASQALFFNGQPLRDESKTLEELGVGNDDMLALRIRDRGTGNGGGGGGDSQQRSNQEHRSDSADPELIRLAVSADPAARHSLQDQNPELAAALDDPQRWRQMYLQMKQQESENARARQREMQALNEDPFNEAAQQRIAEMIRQEQVMENLQNAMENNPEAFGKVNMLYIDVEVNGHKVKAFVDSGAQATILSPSCAERCNIMRLVDTRFAGMAYGVGTAKVLGRVHLAQIKIGNLHLPCSFTVMEGKQVDLLLGLDMLKRHQACIDLKQNKLILMGTEVSFLSEADSPRNEEQRSSEPQIQGPAGTAIGARSGAVTLPGGQSSSQDQASQPPSQQQQQQAGAQPTASRPAQSARQAAGAAAAARQQQANPSHSEEKITQLISLGFPRQRAIAALDRANGSVEFAAGLLFDQG